MRSPMTRLLPVAAALALALPRAALGAGAPPPPRSAIVVGAMAPVPGRAVLRHAHHDAETIRDVLVSVGGFAPAQVHVLRDPEPAALLALVSREAAALSGVPQGMLFFYYSGHADQAALWSAGKAVPIEALRAALDRPEVSLRVGVLDACQGGGWTRAKGLVPDAPFEVAVPALLSSEGSALISSSSGAESAHESDSLRGSFFTHHFAAALRGAADERRAGEVTLTEAFEYARQQTVRETARRAAEPQHPSFALNLKGRQDVVLAQLAQAPAALSVEQADGPVELVHLGSGLRLLELPPGRRQVTLAVPPGTYLVRKVAAAGVLAREVTVPPTGSARVSEADLVLVGAERMALKGAEEAPRAGWPRAGAGEVSVGFTTDRGGVAGGLGLGAGPQAGQSALLQFDGRLGITDRLLWRIGTGAFAFRLGDADGVQLVPAGGLLSWRLPLVRLGDARNWEGYRAGAGEYRAGGHLGLRIPFSTGAFLLTVAADHAWIGDTEGARFQSGLGVTWRPTPSLSLHVGYVSTSMEFRRVARGAPGDPFPTYFGGMTSRYAFGSVLELGLEPLPLVRYSPDGTWSLDLHVVGDRDYGRAIWAMSYRLGVSRPF